MMSGEVSSGQGHMRWRERVLGGGGECEGIQDPLLEGSKMGLDAVCAWWIMTKQWNEK